MHDAMDVLPDQRAEAWGQLRRAVVALCRHGASFRDIVVAVESAIRNEEAHMDRAARMRRCA